MAFVSHTAAYSLCAVGDAHPPAQCGTTAGCEHPVAGSISEVACRTNLLSLLCVANLSVLSVYLIIV